MATDWCRAAESRLKWIVWVCEWCVKLEMAGSRCRSPHAPSLMLICFFIHPRLGRFSTGSAVIWGGVGWGITIWMSHLLCEICLCIFLSLSFCMYEIKLRYSNAWLFTSVSSISECNSLVLNTSFPVVILERSLRGYKQYAHCCSCYRNTSLTPWHRPPASPRNIQRFTFWGLSIIARWEAISPVWKKNSDKGTIHPSHILLR